MTTIETIRFRNDTQTRKRLMVPESFQHPAKGQLGMWALMIERYSQPGDLVLDPMAGSGATLLAALMGRDCVLVELESHFCKPMRRSWAKMSTMPMLGHEMGQAVILRGDARCLPLPDASVEAAITSPPYADERQGGGLATREYQERSLADGTAASGIPGRKNTRIDQWAYTRPVDAIVTSPPYNETLTHGGGGANAEHRLSDGYTRPVDAIVTSPPYGASDQSRDTEFIRKVEKDLRRGSRMQAGYDGTMPNALGNIGNLRGQAYWQAQGTVYEECFRVLRPNGVMALVLKGFTREGKYVDLPGQTEALLLEAGWQKHDHWRRELWSLSFWRILQKRRDPAAWDDRLMYEEVLAFKKPGGEGNGVDAVITSPPYEGSLILEQNGIDEAKLKQPYGPNSQFTRPQNYTRKERP